MQTKRTFPVANITQFPDTRPNLFQLFQHLLPYLFLRFISPRAAYKKTRRLDLAFAQIISVAFPSRCRYAMY
jgi:hypothetical protein